MDLLKLDLIQPREYQLKIAETASTKNTLVVLPTGTGKTIISLLVGIKRLEKYPDSKILITSPTRPLTAQHKKTFETFTRINPEEIALITGKTKPEKREEIYKKAKVIAATPQCIQHDLENGKLNLENFSLIVLDEVHRAVKKYAYPYIAKKYMLQSKHPLILGLTASPGGTPERIREICENLFIEVVEIRTEADEDLRKYMPPVEKEFVYVELPEEFKKIKALLQQVLQEDLQWLKEHKYLSTSRPTRKMLLDLQKEVTANYMHERDHSFWAIMHVVGAIKIEHAIELLETQGILFFYEFLKKIFGSRRKTDRRLANDPRIREAFRIAENLKEEYEHPKLEKVVFIVKDILRENQTAGIIIFANYRSTVDKINSLLVKNGIKSSILIGQTMKQGKGMTQQQQLETLKKFEERKFNVLVASSIGEEGLDYYADFAIFYEPVPSEIRALQRKGRVGRHKAGKIIFLITKGTRDEAYYWAAFRKEKKMKSILYKMREKGVRREKTLIDWLK
jgi:Fanconi anemia group M protein